MTRERYCICKKIKLDKKNVVELEKEMILLFGSIKILLFL